VRASVGGRDRRGVRRVRFYLGKRRVATDRKAPFRKRVDRGRHLGRSHRHKVSAGVFMRDGRRTVLARRFRACANG
jgi:hypothetical protein